MRLMTLSIIALFLLAMAVEAGCRRAGGRGRLAHRSSGGCSSCR